jgi:hypothetical protein
LEGEIIADSPGMGVTQIGKQRCCSLNSLKLTDHQRLQRDSSFVGERLEEGHETHNIQKITSFIGVMSVQAL